MNDPLLLVFKLVRSWRMRDAIADRDMEQFLDLWTALYEQLTEKKAQ